MIKYMIAFVIPTLNEEGNIISLVSSILNIHPGAYLFIVDDNSSDGTISTLKKIYPDHSQIHLIVRTEDFGLGSSLKVGIIEALKYDPSVVITMDADWSHDPAVTLKFSKYLSDFDIIIGSRYLNQSSHKLSFHRSFISIFGNVFLRNLLGINVKDATSGYRCYSMKLLRLIDINTIQAKDYNFQIEILFKLINRGARVCEIPIVFGSRKSGKSKLKLKYLLTSFITIISLWVNYRERHI